jgi:hypothetical protein
MRICDWSIWRWLKSANNKQLSKLTSENKVPSDTKKLISLSINNVVLKVVPKDAPGKK